MTAQPLPKPQRVLPTRVAQAFSWAVLLLLPVYLFCDALGTGGRWALYQPVAMADRWDSQGLAYSAGAADGYLGSTPYFPGVAWLARLAQVLVPGHDVELLLAIGSVSALLLLAALHGVYRAQGGRLPAAAFIATASGLALVVLPEWLKYANELKPDTLSLIAFVAAWALAQRGSPSWARLSLLAGAVALSVVTKQQALAPVTGLAVVLAWQTWKQRRLDGRLPAVVAGTALGLAAAFSVPGAWYFTVLSHAGRAWQSPIDSGHARLAVALLAFGIAAWLLRRRSPTCNEPTRPAVPMGSSASLWLLACVAGALHFGGNASNTHVGLVLLLPWAVQQIERLPRPWLVTTWALTSLSLTWQVGFGDWKTRHTTRLALDAEVAQLLREHKAQRVLATSSSYLSVRTAAPQQVFEFDTWAHIHNGARHTDVPASANDLVQTLQPDAIVCHEGCSLHTRLYGLMPEQLDYKAVPLRPGGTDRALFFRLPGVQTTQSGSPETLK